MSAEFDDHFAYFRESYAESVEKMFAAVSELYATYWNDVFHFALFDDARRDDGIDGQTWDDAFRKTHASYMDALKIREASRVADLACGRGGFARVMAENTPARVIGIDISEAQLSHARKLKRPNLEFRRYDIMKIDELGDTFDAVSFMDAACYLPDKLLAVKKIKKILNPGARFLLIDWCKRERLTAIQEELVLHPFMRYWAVPSLETQRRYERCFRKSGFEILDIQDLNDRVGRNWAFAYDSAIRAVAELSGRDLPKMIWTGMKLGREGLRLIKEQFPAALYIKAGFDAGFLRYSYFLVRNPE